MKNNKLNVLVVEDNQVDLRLIESFLTSSDHGYIMTHAPSLGEGLRLLQADKFDLILFDLGLPDNEGLSGMEKLRPYSSETPIIILTGLDDKEVAISALKMGVQDYVLKNELSEHLLIRTINHTLERFSASLKNEQEERKKKEIAFERLSIVASRTETSIVVTDKDGLISWVNEGFTKLTQYTLEEVEGKKPGDILQGPLTDRETIKRMAAAFRDKRGFQERILNYRKDGETYWISTNVNPVFGENGDIVEWVGVGMDVSRHVKFDKLKDEFVSTVSHELRTPLTIIREATSQIYEGILGDINEAQRKYLSKMIANIDRLSNIINDLLDISRIQEGRFALYKEEVNLNEVVKEVVISFTPQVQAQGLQILNSFSHHSIIAFVDKEKLIQVLTNLIGNALKFTQEGHIGISLIDKGKEVECRVSDTGPGIDKEDIGRIFDKFQQVGRTSGPGQKGTGLGLSISKGIVELHRGKIWVTSEPGKGCEFIFTLPKLTKKESQLLDLLEQSIQDSARKSEAFSVVRVFLEGEDVPENQDSFWEQGAAFVKEDLHRKFDTVFVGGKDLFIILPETNPDDAQTIAERIKKSLQGKYDKSKWKQVSGLAYRYVTYPQDVQDKEEILERLNAE